ncbi:hypothetical protein DFQ26_000534, partial [Actinomortierella ambigua]
TPCFSDEKDREEIKSTSVTGRSGDLPALTPAEPAFLQPYDLPPTDLHKLICTQGSRSVGDALEKKPSEEFQVVAHESITRVLRTYWQNRMTFPCEPSQAWFNHQLWGFLTRALCCCSVLEYRSGDVTSEASDQRRRKQRVQKDGGASTWWCLHDTRRLMKAGHDMIREMAEQNIRSRLATFSIRISGPTVTIFSLHQCPDRFYQSVEEYTKSLPLIWSAHGTTTVLAIVT